MRLVTFNILNGRSPSDGEVHPGRFAEAVAALRPDVLALQEVDRAQPRSGAVDFTMIAAEAMGAVASRFVAAMTGTPGLVWTAATGEEHPDTAAYGIALLSRYPVRGWSVLRLPRLPFPAPVKPHDRWRLFLTRDEQRVAVTAEITGPGGDLSVTATHLTFVPGWNVRQLRYLLKVLDGCPLPGLVVGDLNLTPSWLRRMTEWRPLASALTYPSREPRLQLDHVLADPRMPSCSPSASAVGLEISDHRALVVDL
jgi:endonuclease/exonuclease/phosphatase family metal-dependent hydrolase